MKMRKSTWLLLVLALAAILLVAGCAPTTPGNGDEEPGNGEPTPPPADKECPEPVSTVVSNVYSDKGNVKLTITFNEAITSGCIENPNKWEIVVKNSGRKDTELTKPTQVKNLSVDLSTDGKKAYVYATVTEKLTYVVKDVVYTVGDIVYTASGPYTVEKDFKGLICSEDDADDYATPDEAEIWGNLGAGKEYGEAGNDILDYTILSGPKTPKSADKVEWKLKDCVVADELGNACCDYSGSACCLEPTCAECEDGCDLGSEGSCL